MAESNNNHSRRKFLALGLFAGAGMVAGKASAQPIQESGETVPMLTKEGKLVYVDKAMIPPTSEKKQANKKDVLSWIHPRK